LDKNDFIAACRDGGSAMDRALRSLDGSFHAILYRECRRVIRDADLARDLVQETFIKVWRRCATFQGSSDLLPWIRTILRHTILDRLRAGARDLSLERNETSLQDLERRLAEHSARSVDTPHDEARAADVADCFERCWLHFQAECPEHAAVIAWIAEDGLGNSQIAELLGRTPGATREYIRQCRKRARVYLADWHELAFGHDGEEPGGPS
jgi:RNA polymerase sigma-70 factor (ECF subfamily)